MAWLTVLVVAGAALVLQLFISRAVTASRQGLVQTEATLSEASTLAASTAGVADRIAQLGGGVADGLGSSSAALDATQSLAGAVNQLIEVLAAVSSKVRTVSADLGAAQQQLRDVQTRLAASETQVRATLPQLQESATTLRELPQQLADARNGVASSRRSLGPLALLARVAVGLLALAAALAVLVMAESAVLRATGPARATG